MIRLMTTLVCLFFVLPAFSYDEEAKEEIFLSTPEQVASLSSEPGLLIGGIISPLSGAPTLRQTDLIVKGAQELALSRVYTSPHVPAQLANEKYCKEAWEKIHLHRYLIKNYKGWQLYPHTKLKLNRIKRHVLVTEPNGSTVSFVFTDSSMTSATFDGPSHGISNCAGDSPSGSNDLRNTRISYDKDEKRITVDGVDKTRRIYQFSRAEGDGDLYLLAKEILPTGKVIRYHYKQTHLSCVESLDPSERFVYASIQAHGDPWSDQKINFLSSSGQTASYEYEKKTLDVYQKEITKKRWIFEDYFQSIEAHCLYPPILTKVDAPSFRKEQIGHCERLLLESYDGKDQLFKILNGEYGAEAKHYRAHLLLLPVGENNAFVPVYEMAYQPPIAGKKCGHTTVKASDGTSTIYHFSKNLLMAKIQHFSAEGILKKEKEFFWDDKNWLKSYELRDGQGALFYKKSFEYDQFGNPTLEILTGDLSGSGEIESTWTKRTFSDDGKNLLLTEEEEGGKTTSFSYFKDTSLLSSKFIQQERRIIQREFWSYDEFHNLREKVSDDGESKHPDDLTGVTQRLKTSYILRSSDPFLHMPQWVIETCLDPGGEKLLKKSHLIYDERGNVTCEEVYDAEENFAYAIERTYNERGDIVSETNRLGAKATYAYDEKGRKVAETNFSGRLHKTYTYDTKGRLCSTLEQGDDSSCHATNSKYDFHDRLTEKKDLYGNSTYYQYDPLAGEISQTDFPKIAAPDGGFCDVKSTSSYDPFRREVTHTDANGNTTSYSYNVYGSRSEIKRPEGGTQTWLYGKNGNLISETDADGLTIEYENDVLGRVLKKTYISQEGSNLAEETFTYSSFHLTSQTDKEGNLKCYFYDGAGRKTREEYCGRVTEFAYDPLGRLATVYKYNGDDALVTHYERDLEDRVTSEKKTDLSGRTLYKAAFSYDADGNRESITRWINSKKATEFFTYDPFGRVTCYRDALGHETQTSYNETLTNSLGQHVLQITKIDPKKVAYLETYDALNQKARVETLSSSSQVISSSEMIYDPHGNLTLHKDHIYEDGNFQSSQAVRYLYTPEHEIKAMIRGYCTGEERETHYAYSKMGKMIEKSLPSGESLFYTYHPLGFLARIDSSNAEIAHSFAHDKIGNLVCAVDENHNLKIDRKIDPFGNVLYEALPYGMQVTKTYDDFDRPVSLNIEGHGQVIYNYNPLFLKEIKRVSKRGTTVYKHTYNEYDQSGNLIQETPAGDLNPVFHATDVRRQKTHIESPYFSQECIYDSNQNLISTTTDHSEFRYQYDENSQMTQEIGPCACVTYSNDSLYNRTGKNSAQYEINSLNELLFDGEFTHEYDLRGNRVLSGTHLKKRSMAYDLLNQLIEVSSESEEIKLVYDPLGRRIAKIISTKDGREKEKSICEYYLYDGEEEIGSFKSPDTLESFRVLNTHTPPKTVSIEVEGKVFATFTDVQDNIRRLVDIYSKTLAASYDFSAFGENFSLHDKNAPHNPWQFASKRFDPSLNLIYFGKRYYDPKTGRWLTTDPIGFEDSFNLYQYALNNPFRYYDPNGESLGGYLFGIGQIALGTVIVAGGFAIEVGTLGGFTIGIGLTTSTGAALIGAGLATTTYHAQDMSVPGKLEFPSFRPQAYHNDDIITTPDPEGYGNITRMEKNDGPPRSREAQQKEANDAKKEIENEIGRKLTPKEKRQFHDYITGQGYDYHELVEEGVGLFNGP